MTAPKLEATAERAEVKDQVCDKAPKDEVSLKGTREQQLSDKEAAYDQGYKAAYYDKDCQISPDLKKDFQEGMKEANVKNDPNFSDENMCKDTIKEFDYVKNDARIADNCEKDCKNEGLGKFEDSEIQHLFGDKYIYRCNCAGTLTDWYTYNSKTDVDKKFGSSTQNLLDDEEECAPQGQESPALQAGEGEEAETTEAPVETCADDGDLDEEDESDIDFSAKIEEAKSKRGGSAPMHSNLGDCFDDFIKNKFSKLHQRLNKLKAKNSGYIQNIHKKQLKKQAGKVEDAVDKSTSKVGNTDLAAGSACVPSKAGADNLKNVQANLNDLKNKRDTAEDKYFKTRNTKDQDAFNQKLKSRFDTKQKNEEKRFDDRFENTDRYAARDNCVEKPKVALAAGAVAAVKPQSSDNDAFINDEVGKIKLQNKDYLSKIKCMFGGGETSIDSQ